MKKKGLLVQIVVSMFVCISVLNMPFNAMASAIVLSNTDNEGSILGQGMSGNIAWKVNDTGLLTLTGEGDYVLDQNNRPPWYAYAGNITAAVVNIKGITNTSYMFFHCTSLKNIDVSKLDTSNVTNMEASLCFQVATV